MSRRKTTAVNCLLLLAIAGIVVGLLIPSQPDPCVGNPDEFNFKKLALRYHLFFAENKRSPSNGRELADFSSGDLGPHLTAESIDCTDLLADEHTGLIFVQWNAAIAPDCTSNSECILAYRFSPDPDGRWAVRGDGSSVYLSPDEFANINLMPTVDPDGIDGG